MKKKQFFHTKDSEAEDGSGDTQQFAPPYRDDGIGLIHYVRRIAEKGEDGRWRIFLTEVKTYEPRTYTLDKLAGNVGVEFNSQLEYDAWLVRMGLPDWAKTQSELM